MARTLPTAETVFGAIERNGTFIDRYLDSPPQTNETGRSAILLPCFLHLRKRFDKPLVLSELGSSAGLNQNWHRYRYEYGHWSWGDLDSPVTLACEWRGDEPPPVRLRVRFPTAPDATSRLCRSIRKTTGCASILCVGRPANAACAALRRAFGCGSSPAIRRGRRRR
jgi:hypothetical protein